MAMHVEQHGVAGPQPARGAKRPGSGAISPEVSGTGAGGGNPSEPGSDPQLFYSRWEDGSLPIRVYRGGPGGRWYEVLDPARQVPVERHLSTRSLLTRLQGADRHWGHERYFGLGRWAQGPEDEGDAITVLDLFTGRRAGEEALSVGPEREPAGVSGSRAITVARMVGRGALNLEGRFKEVAKLLFKGFGLMIRRAGWDEQDVLQEVYKGLLTRNQPGMRSAWDPAKSSFGHYIHMVCRSVVFNYHRKQERVGRILVGCVEYADGDLSATDVASSSRFQDGASMWQEPTSAPDSGIGAADPILRLMSFLRTSLSDPLDVMFATAMLPLVVDGHGQRDVAKLMGLTRAEYKGLRARFDEACNDWRDLGCP